MLPTLTSLVLFLAFLGFIIIKLREMPRSLSKSYYLFEKPVWFVVWTLAYGLPLVFAETLSLKMAGIGVIIVASAPAGRAKGLEGFLHVAGVYIAVLCGVIRFATIGYEGDILIKAIFWGALVLMGLFTWYAMSKPIKKHTAILEIMAVVMFEAGHLISF